MSGKKKVDLATELADLLLDEQPTLEKLPSTRQLGTVAAQPLATPTQNLPPTRHLDTIAKSSTSTEMDASDKTIAVPKTNSDLPAIPKSTNFPPGSNSEITLDMGKKSTAQSASSPVTQEQKVKTEVPNLGEGTLGLSEIFSSQKSSEKITKKSSGSDVILSAESSLIQAEKLRLAQERILELEKVVEGLRFQNEELLAAGEALRKHSDELRAQVEQNTRHLKDTKEIYEQELAISRQNVLSKGEDVDRMKLKIEELETRLSHDIKRIRVRERELENRLEIMRLESGAVMKNKDEVILDLKRKIDQMSFEIENYRSKSKEMNNMMEENRERIRRTVKALRLALSQLEGDEEPTPLKKAE